MSKVSFSALLTLSMLMPRTALAVCETPTTLSDLTILESAGEEAFAFLETLLDHGERLLGLCFGHRELENRLRRPADEVFQLEGEIAKYTPVRIGEGRAQEAKFINKIPSVANIPDRAESTFNHNYMFDP